MLLNYYVHEKHFYDIRNEELSDQSLTIGDGYFFQKKVKHNIIKVLRFQNKYSWNINNRRDVEIDKKYYKCTMLTIPFAFKLSKEMQYEEIDE